MRLTLERGSCLLPSASLVLKTNILMNYPAACGSKSRFAGLLFTTPIIF